MKRIIFSAGINAVEALGTVTRMVAIADEVKRMEPDTAILFRSSGSEAGHIKNHGYETVDGYKPNIMGFPDAVWKVISLLQGEWNGKVSDLKRLDDIIRLKGIYTRKYVETTYIEWMRLVGEFKPDIIVSEFDLVAPIAARKAGIPLFTTYGAVGAPSYYSELFYHAPSRDRRLCVHYNRLLKRLKMPKIHAIAELFSGYGYSRRLIPSIPSMEDVAEDDRTHYTGSIIPDRFGKSAWNWVKRRPLIFVYLSIGQITARLAEETLISAFSESDFDVAMAGAGHPYFEKKGEYHDGNVHFYRFLPVDEVLKQADLAIHHGGQNTTMQCIEARVPALIFPGRHFERHFNAKKAAEAGCAYCLKNEDFTTENLMKYSVEIIRNQPFRQSLEIHSKTIKGYGGKQKAAGLILHKALS
jgi:UDP-N-acetylglucosamine:LPS N-acetylglucosamine transferase